MTFAELVAETSIEAGITKRLTRQVLEGFFWRLQKAVWRHGRAVVPGLAAFNVRRVKARDQALNDTGKVPAHRVVRARVSKSWRRRA